MKQRESCKHGHPLSGDNLYVAPKTGIRGCRTCRRSSRRAYGQSYGRQNDHWMFSGNREPAIQRDGEKCVKCGMTREEHRRRYNRDITVDHIDGRGSGTPKHLKNNQLDNLQTLCLRCHGKKDRQRGSVKYVLTPEKVSEIKKFLESMSVSDVARHFGLAYQHVYHINTGEIWRDVKPKEGF